jgi:hypothetical protein
MRAACDLHAAAVTARTCPPAHPPTPVREAEPLEQEAACCGHAAIVGAPRLQAVAHKVLQQGEALRGRNVPQPALGDLCVGCRGVCMACAGVCVAAQERAALQETLAAPARPHHTRTCEDPGLDERGAPNHGRRHPTPTNAVCTTSSSSRSRSSSLALHAVILLLCVCCPQARGPLLWAEHVAVANERQAHRRRDARTAADVGPVGSAGVALLPASACG